LLSEADVRSPIGPLLVIIGLAVTVVLVLLLFVNLGTRSELEAELAELRTTVEEMEPGVTFDELEQQLVTLEGGIRDWLIATGADGGFDTSPGTEGATGTALVERLDEILERIDALDQRIDQICDGVPVC
jgi:hypothetical protein